MRYHFLRRRPQSPMFRWLQFSGRGWLDAQAPEVEGLLLLAGPGSAASRPVLRDGHGRELPLEILVPGPDLPENAERFLRLPEDRRWLNRIRWQMPVPQTLVLADETTGTTLALITPEVVFPDHLFALVQQAGGRFDNFVETGTLFGHTTLHASYWVDRVVTIELSRDLHAQAVAHLAHRPGVTCLQGNSGEVLPRVVPDLQGSTLFYLDAHWSGDASVNWEASKFKGYPVDTAQIPDAPSAGAAQVPLLDELACILEAHRGPACIVIDDWNTLGTRDLNFAGEDWSHIDRAEVLALMDAHPRSIDHHDDGPKRHIWQIAPLI